MSESCLIECLSRDGRLGGPDDAALASHLDCNNDGQSTEVGTPEEVAPGIFFLRGATRYFQDGAREGPAGAIRRLMCNNGWIDLGDCVLLIDANMPARADALLEAVRSTTHKPVRYLFNTHHHGDHIYGNRAIFERTGAEIIASEGLVAEMRRYETGAFGGPPGRWEQVAKARPDVAATPIMAPTRTFRHSLRIERGARSVDLLWLGLAHTRGDAVAWIGQDRVAFTGDLVTNGPFNIVRDSVMLPWLGTLRALNDLAPAIVCPGHGYRDDRSLIVQQRYFLSTLIEQVRLRLAQGGSRDAVLASVEDIRAALLADRIAARFVIPAEADLAVLSLSAQVERTVDQLLEAKSS